jgi:hypothetical protein
MMRTICQIAIIAALLSAGCNSKTPSVSDADPATGVEFKHDESGMSLELNSKDGIELPDGFPADVATPEQATVVSAIHLDKADAYTFQTEGSQSMQQVYESLRGKMLSDGWQDQASSIGETGASLAFKKEARIATYSIHKQGKAVAVMLTLTK